MDNKAPEKEEVKEEKPRFAVVEEPGSLIQMAHESTLASPLQQAPKGRDVANKKKDEQENKPAFNPYAKPN